jgi:dTDP-4-amino-4,6-dideoxygalactose transaminase
MTATLAIDGGIPVRTTPVPTWPQIPTEGRAAVDAVLASGKINYWTGTQAKQFEEECVQSTNTAFALAVSNGTVALEVALRSFGIGSGDEVIVPSRTFIATAGSVVAVGATPIIADIDPQTNCLSALTIAKVTTPRTRAVVVVHIGGYPAPMDEIISFTDQLNILVIEDCAQAQGALYHGRPIGSIGNAGCYSFCQEKILCLGEGGMVLYREGAGAREAYEKGWAYRDHGRNWGLAHNATVGAASSGFKYLNDSFGTNARLGEIEGALGRVLLKKLPAYHATRKRNTEILLQAFKDLPGLDALTLPVAEVEAGSELAYYRLYGRVDIDHLAPGWTRDRVIDAINAEGVPVQYGASAFIGREAAFALAGLEVNEDLPGATYADARSIGFFVHPTLTEADMADIATATHKVMTAAYHA